MDEKQPVKQQLSRPPVLFLSLQTVAEILKVIQPLDTHLNSFGDLGLGFFCQGYADLFKLPSSQGSYLFFFFLFLLELISIMFIAAAFR